MFDREVIMFLVDLVIRGLAVVLFIGALYLINKYNLQKWVSIAVKAAEMIYNMPGMGAEKKQWVLEFLANKLKLVTAEELDAMIEAAVQEIQKYKNRINPVTEE